MKNYSLFIVALFLAFSLSLAGQAQEARQDEPAPFWYAQLFGGINKSANENLPWSEMTSAPLSGGFFVAVGQEMASPWGWRTAFRFNHNRSRAVPECENDDTWGWNSLELFADATYNLVGRLGAAQRFNLKAFAGLGLGYTYAFPQHQPLSYTQKYSRNSTVQGTVRLGLTATYALSRSWALGAEVSQSFFTDAFNGVKTGAPADARTNLKVGLTYLFLPPKPRVVLPVSVPRDQRLRTIPPLPFRQPEEEDEKLRSIRGRAFLDFPVNETVIYPRYRRNPAELKRIRHTIESTLFDRTIAVRSISLHGYASPESPYSNNTRLAKGRTAALKEYIQNAYAFSDTLFTTTFTPEDWKNLRNFIAHGGRRKVKDDIWYEDASVLETPAMPSFVRDAREELLEVIDSSLKPDEKEQQLKQVAGGKPYRWLLDHVYPGLRHTDYVIQYVVRHYPVQQSRRLIYTHPEALSLSEMYRVAESWPEGSDDWLDALLIAARQYPESETANLNAACACVKTRRLTDAKHYLSLAGKSQDAQYVQQVIDAMEGRYTGTFDYKHGK